MTTKNYYFEDKVLKQIIKSCSNPIDELFDVDIFKRFREENEPKFTFWFNQFLMNYTTSVASKVAQLNDFLEK